MIAFSSKMPKHLAIGAACMFAAFAAGCSGDTMPGFLQTGALGDSGQQAAGSEKAAVDPVCVSLATQIDKLHQDGAVDRLEKAADGKAQDVKVKRTALVTQAQLNKANADFIAKCGPKLPKPAVTASVATTTAPAVPAASMAPPATKTAAQAAAASNAGVTVAPPSAPKE